METIEKSLQTLKKCKNIPENHKRILAKEYVQLLTEPQYDVSEIANQLAFIVQEINESITRMDMEYCTQLVCFSKTISKGLRIHSQQQNALKYFYFGQFQAKLEDLEKELTSESEKKKIREALSGRHTKEILSTLYRSGECRQSELVRLVDVDKGNLSRIIEKLIGAELVEKRKLEKFCFYSLTPKARRLLRNNSLSLVKANNNAIFTRAIFVELSNYYLEDCSESVLSKLSNSSVWDCIDDDKDLAIYSWR